MKLIAPLTMIFLAAPFAAMAGGAEIPVAEPQIAAPVAMAPQSTDWTGFYAGLSFGAGNSYGSTAGSGGDMGVAGVNLGYRRDMGRVVVGGELSYDKDDIGQDGTGISNTAALKLTVGTPVGERTLVYGLLGASRAEATLGGVSGTDIGYTAGLGADYALNDKWTIGGEVAMDRYDDFNNSGIDLKDTTMKLKVGMRF